MNRQLDLHMDLKHQHLVCKMAATENRLHFDADGVPLSLDDDVDDKLEQKADTLDAYTASVQRAQMALSSYFFRAYARHVSATLRAVSCPECASTRRWTCRRPPSGLTSNSCAPTCPAARLFCEISDAALTLHWTMTTSRCRRCTPCVRCSGISTTRACAQPSR